MSETAATLLTALLSLTAVGALIYFAVRNMIRSLRNVNDAIDEEVTRRRTIDSSQLREIESRVASTPPPPSPQAPTPVAPKPAAEASNPFAIPGVPSDFAAELQAQAKARDDAHKAEIRAHVERAVPPISDEGREAIERGQRARLAIKHVFPPRLPQRSMSYFGGLPIVPDSFDWPTLHNSKGLLERPNFMAQIDCADLPPGPGRDLLPDKGFLYFFAPMSLSFGADAMHFVARYLAGPVTKKWEPLDMPFTGKIEPADRMGMAWRAERTHYDRVEVEFGWIEEPTDEEVAARTGEGHAHEVAQKIEGEKEEAFFGPVAAHDPMLSAHEAPKDALWTPYSGFPANWATARILRRLVDTYYREESEDVTKRLEALGEVAEDDPEAKKLKALQNELWGTNRKISDAFSATVNLNHKDADPVPDEEKQKIMEFLEELRVNGMPSSKERHYLHHQLPMILKDWLSFAAVHGAETGLTDPDGAAHINADVVRALAQRHGARKHQMLGEGEVVQVAADEMKDRYILLLQLGPDQALNWLIGEMGPLQYWITPEDLAAKRFENTILTIEAY